MVAQAEGRAVSVLGTDLNGDAIAHAERGVYAGWTCRGLPPAHARGLVQLDGDRHQVAPSLRRAVRFERHNLLAPPPPAPLGGGWDLVLCRNVLIYFAPAQAAATVARLAGALGDGGWLLLGASEMLHGAGADVRPIEVAGRQVLQKSSAPSGAIGVTKAPYAAPIVAPPPPAAPPAGTDPSPLVAEAHRRHAAGRHAEALELYAQALVRDPLCAEARMGCGLIHHKLDDDATALVELRAALFLQPELWPAAFYLALTYERMGCAAEARREYRRVVECGARPLALGPSPAGGPLEELDAWRGEAVHIARERCR
jgi:chemotaxis protein methyltransferase CheR